MSINASAIRYDKMTRTERDTHLRRVISMIQMKTGYLHTNRVKFTACRHCGSKKTVHLFDNQIDGEKQILCVRCLRNDTIKPAPTKQGSKGVYEVWRSA